MPTLQRSLPLFISGVLGSLTLSGCTGLQIHKTRFIAQENIGNPDNQPDNRSSAILDEILALFIAPTQQQSPPAPTPAPGPELVAGDWLAWQCADVGRYWDIFLEPDGSAPTLE